MGDVDDATPRGGLGYWLVVLLLTAVGLLTIFSFGIFVWTVAAAMILLSPFRSRPTIFRPGLALALGFLAGYLLISPWGCRQSFSADPVTGESAESPVVCTSPIGIEYTGPDPFEPSPVPAVIGGGVLATLAAGITLAVTLRDESARTSR